VISSGDKGMAGGRKMKGEKGEKGRTARRLALCSISSFGFSFSNFSAD